MNKATELYVSKAQEEVWAWKEKAYQDTKDLSFEQLQEHYKKSVEKAAILLGMKIIQMENGAYKFAK